MRLNKNVLIVFLLLSVFAVGTMTFIEPAEAAKWKKFDSGNFKSNSGSTKYISYIKGSNEIRMDIYQGEKITTKNYFTKNKNKLTHVIKNANGKTVHKKSYTTKASLKTFYKQLRKSF